MGRRSGPRLLGSALGPIAGGVAVATAHLTAGILSSVGSGRPSPIVAVAGATIDLSPGWLTEFGIRTFGAADKPVLLGGIALVLAIAAVLLGIASVRRPWVGQLGLLVFVGVGVAASLTRAGARPTDAIPSLIGGGFGLAALWWLRRVAGLPARGAEPAGEPATSKERSIDLDRRRFVIHGLAMAGGAALTASIGQSLLHLPGVTASRRAIRIPAPMTPAPPAAGADLRVAGLSRFFTPNEVFYRVDTAILLPAVEARDWRLRIHGMVDREVTMNFEQLLARPLIEHDMTLACVSNQVGGDLVGNARWIGAPLRDLLEQAGVHPDATQIVSRSVDGFTAGTPTEVVMDGRDSMLAVGMNGEPLPLAHGFPVRMLVPGLYGYVSATKWLVDIELTRFEDFTAYWVRQGWAQRAPIKTESRIDTPRAGASIGAGIIPVAGVAWAPHRGISAVEVRIDDGPWTTAQLTPGDTVDTWRQWVYRWAASPGEHAIQVRATDGTGTVQTAERATPFPDGATGYHTIQATVG